MPKNTNIQMIDNLANNFHGYAVLLRKIKQRVLITQQRARRCRLGQENFATLIRGFEERVFRNKGLLCTQYAVYDTIFQ